MSLQNYFDLSSEMLDEAGYRSANIEDLVLPNTYYMIDDGVQVPYSVTGDLKTAETVLVTTPDYTSDIKEPFNKVIAAANQTVLGNNVATIAVQAYAAGDIPFSEAAVKNPEERVFPELARRVIAIASSRTSSDQNVVLTGSSLGADVMTQVANDLAFDPNLGVMDFSILGINDPGRVINRSAIKMIAAFVTSGKRQFENTTGYPSPALLDSRNIDSHGKLGSLKYQARVGRDVAKYIAKSPRDALVVPKAFGTDTTIQNLNRLAQIGLADRLYVSRATDSTIFVKAGIQALDPVIRLEEYVNDHSATENLAINAGLSLAFSDQFSKV